MAYMYPYGDSQQLNLSWFLAKFKELYEYVMQLDPSGETAMDVILSRFTEQYDSTKTYIPGDYCIYDGYIYKANTTTGGTFNSSAWDAALPVNDVQGLRILLGGLSTDLDALEQNAVTNVQYTPGAATADGLLRQTKNGTASTVMTVDKEPTENSQNPVKSGGVYDELTELKGSINEDHIFLMSDSYGIFAAAGGKSWEGFVRDYLQARGKTVTMNATGGAGFGYQSSHADYQQCYYPNIIDGYTADATINMILILTGANDGNLLYGSATNEATIKTGIADSVTKLRTKFQNASIHLGFVGRYRTSNHFASYKTARDIYKNACAENGIAFADNFEYILHNRNMINSTDLVHPTLAGSELIGKYATEYILRKGISVIYEDVYTIASGDSWLEWSGKKLKVKVCNETTFVVLNSTVDTYEMTFGLQQAMGNGIANYLNETLSTEQHLLTMENLSDSCILLTGLWLDANGTTNMMLPARLSVTDGALFVEVTKPYAVTFPVSSQLRIKNSYVALDTMLT